MTTPKITCFGANRPDGSHAVYLKIRRCDLQAAHGSDLGRVMWTRTVHDAPEMQHPLTPDEARALAAALVSAADEIEQFSSQGE